MPERKPRASFLPQTILGKLTLGLIIAMPILFIIGTAMVNRYPMTGGDTIAQDIAARPALALSMLAAMLCGTAAFITGLVSLIKQKDRSIAVYIATIIGGLLLALLLGEFIMPH